jgi:tetratricopeptide (TPR) repeat protein
MSIPAEWLGYAPKPTPLPKGILWNVFLSYRSVNRPWVLNLYDVLVELGYKVFLDQYVLKAGDPLVEVLEDGLDKSQAGVLIWSTAAKDSAWVRNEYNTLMGKSTNDKNFHFVPVKLDSTRLPAFADTRLFVDFSDYPDGPSGGDLLKLLYGITGTPFNKEVAHFANEQDEEAMADAAKVKAAIRNKKPARLMQLFAQRGLPWKTTAALGCKAAEGLIKLKCNDEALQMLEQLQKSFSKAVRPKQLKVLALARRGKDGDLDQAQDIIGELYASNHLDPETLGIYGRTWMDRYDLSKEPEDLWTSRKYYADAFEKAPDDYYTGINAASKSVLLGEFDVADEYVKKVEAIVGAEPVADDYWQTATIGEVLLIKKQYKEAAAMYKKAVEMAPTEIASHESTQKQAERLMDKLGPAATERQLVVSAFE